VGCDPGQAANHLGDIGANCNDVGIDPRLPAPADCPFE
jgi:hypothetical protein